MRQVLDVRMRNYLFVSSEYIYLRLPKTGSTALIRSIEKSPEFSLIKSTAGWHPKVSRIVDYIGGRTVFYIYRDPIERFLSGYFYFAAKPHKMHGAPIEDFYNGIILGQDIPSVEKFKKTREHLNPYPWFFDVTEGIKFKQIIYGKSMVEELKSMGVDFEFEPSEYEIDRFFTEEQKENIINYFGRAEDLPNNA